MGFNKYEYVFTELLHILTLSDSPPTPRLTAIRKCYFLGVCRCVPDKSTALSYKSKFFLDSYRYYTDK